ncbi:MAG: multidrug transporter [Anaerolineales bacterium]
MRKVLLHHDRHVAPFNEPARDLRVLNKPLWLHQRDLLARYTSEEIEVRAPGSYETIPSGPGDRVEQVVFADNLFFDQGYIDAFLQEAIASGQPRRAAFTLQDSAFREHALPLAEMFTPSETDKELFLADLWYFPEGPTPAAEPLVIDLQAREVGYYWVPSYMATDQGDLLFQVPLRALMSIESWVHIFLADVAFGLFARGARAEHRLATELGYTLKLFWRSLVELKQVLDCSELVQIGRGCTIDPTAIIHGPTTIGDNVTIGAGAVIDNCVIGSNVNISQGCQVMLSVVGDGSFLPFRSSLFMTTLMENSMVAQNTCLQMCVIGRNTFIGAGNTFTDYNLIPTPIRAATGSGELKLANRDVLGGVVGHNCRIGSGLVIYPARMIESDVVLFASPERRVIDKNVYYEDSDHHKSHIGHLHQRLYHRAGEEVELSW